MKTTTSINFDCEMLKALKQYAYENDRSVSNVVMILINDSEIFRKFMKERRQIKSWLKSKSKPVIETWENRFYKR